jgi:hypothetical protein
MTRSVVRVHIAPPYSFRLPHNCLYLTILLQGCILLTLTRIRSMLARDIPTFEKLAPTEASAHLDVIALPRKSTLEATAYILRHGQDLSFEDEGSPTEEALQPLHIKPITDAELGKPDSYFDALPKPEIPLSQKPDRYRALPGGFASLELANGSVITIKKTSVKER